MDLIEILLVEDDPHDQELIVRSLKKHNLTNKMHIVHNGEEALKFLNNLPNTSLKVILLDLKLPKVSGLEVLKVIKDSDTLCRIPVVVLTSSAEDPDVKTAYKLGVNSFVTKPIDFGEFMKVVAEIGFYWGIINKTC